MWSLSPSLSVWYSAWPSPGHTPWSWRYSFYQNDKPSDWRLPQRNRTATGGGKSRFKVDKENRHPLQPSKPWVSHWLTCATVTMGRGIFQWPQVDSRPLKVCHQPPGLSVPCTCFPAYLCSGRSLLTMSYTLDPLSGMLYAPSPHAGFLFILQALSPKSLLRLSLPSVHLPHFLFSKDQFLIPVLMTLK